MLKWYDAQTGVAVARRTRKGCPPHGPHLMDAVDGGSSYVVRCLKCGLVGPARKDGAGAKLAFDRRWR